MRSTRQQHAAPALAPRRSLVGAFSRRHIDRQRVAGALCTG